jgi:hypothetical protein
MGGDPVLWMRDLKKQSAQKDYKKKKTTPNVMEPTQVLVSLTANLEKLKKDDPGAYLSLLKQVQEITSSYDADLKAALAEATSTIENRHLKYE